MRSAEKVEIHFLRLAVAYRIPVHKRNEDIRVLSDMLVTNTMVREL
jgi:hypothetical protein